MTSERILKTLEEGNTVTYTVRRLRDYLHGDASLVFRSQDKVIGLNNIAHKLKCFRFDEKPYDNPCWTVS